MEHTGKKGNRREPVKKTILKKNKRQVRSEVNQSVIADIKQAEPDDVTHKVHKLETDLQDFRVAIGNKVSCRLTRS